MLSSVSIALLLATTPPADGAAPTKVVNGLDKVPVAHQDVVRKYADTLGKKVDVEDVETHEQAGDSGQEIFTQVLLGETTGSDGGCRYRQHTLDLTTTAGKTENQSKEYASDCCELVLDFPCDRTGLDWMLHYQRALAANNGKALAALVFKSMFVKVSWPEDGKPKSETHKVTAAQLAKGKLSVLPTIDPIRMSIDCSDQQADGTFQCSAGQGGNHMMFTWKHVGDKTKQKFETKLLKITQDQD